MANKAFVPGANSLEGRQFAFTLEEALKYAENDLTKVAVIKVTVEESVIKGLDFSKSIDPHIFVNGVITVHLGEASALFHKAIVSIAHVL